MSRSNQLFQQAQTLIPGGVNSPVRAFKSVGGTPLFISHGKGPYLYDEDQQCYIDYVGSWGGLILGHAHPEVLKAVHAALDCGLSFGAPTVLEVQLAEKICQRIPSIEQVRLVNSGTEATMTALRLARGSTKRNKVIKFAGCYHGHVDALLVKAGSGALTLGQLDSAGIPKSTVEHTLVAQYNQLDSVTALFEQYGKDIAAIIVEPIAGNMGCIPPTAGFLQGLRELCDQYRSVLIFDEVMTGFRVAQGGAQALFNITPDLTTLGKIIGGGMPIGAVGGRKEIMSELAPLGPVYQAGTLSGNPIAVTAGLATLNELSSNEFYTNLEQHTKQLVDGITACAKATRIPLITHQVCGMFGLFFTEQEEVRGLDDVMNGDTKRYAEFFHGLLKQGIYYAPSAFEAGFISSAHTSEMVEYTLSAIEQVFAKRL